MKINRHTDWISNRISIDYFAWSLDFNRTQMLNKLKDVADLPKLVTTLKNYGYNDADLEKLSYKNWLRVIKNTWK